MTHLLAGRTKVKVRETLTHFAIQLALEGRQGQGMFKDGVGRDGDGVLCTSFACMLKEPGGGLFNQYTPGGVLIGWVFFFLCKKVRVRRKTVKKH